MELEPELISELLDLPGAPAKKVVSQYRSREGKTSEESTEIGRLCMSDDDYEGAVIHFLRALEQEEGDRYHQHLDLGAAYESSGMGPEAFRQYKNAEKIKDTGEAARSIAALLASYGKNSEAVAMLERAEEIEPGNAYNTFVRAELLRKMGKHKASLEAIAKLVSSSPEDAQYHVWMGELLLEMHRFDDSVSAFSAAVDVSPGDDKVYQSSAVALWGAGKRVEAIRAIRLASDLNPEDCVNYGLLEVLLRIDGQDLESQQESKKAAQMDTYERGVLDRLLSHIGIALD